MTTVPCPTCGAGRVALSGPLSSALRAMRGGKVTSLMVSARLGISVPAAGMRLARLERLGLIERTGKVGRWWEYRVRR